MPLVKYEESKGLYQQNGTGINLVVPRYIAQWNYIDCTSPIVSFNQVDAAAVGGSGDQMGLIMPDTHGNMRCGELYRIAAFTAAGTTPRIEGTVPSVDTSGTAAGLNLQLDHNTTDNCGAEMHFGGSCFGNAVNKYTVGTHEGYIEATFHTAEYNDWDKIIVGFRSAEAFNAAPASVINTADGTYADFVEFGMIGGADKLQTRTDANNSGTTVLTDTGETVTDDQNIRIRVTLSKSGDVTYSFIKNAVAGSGTLAEPGTVAAYTFGSGDTVVPYIVFHGAGTDDVPLFLKDLEISKTPRATSTFR